MENPFDEMRRAINQARAINNAADNAANSIVDLLDGRLRQVSPYRLAKIKKQLRDFNMHTKEWKS